MSWLCNAIQSSSNVMLSAWITAFIASVASFVLDFFSTAPFPEYSIGKLYIVLWLFVRSVFNHRPIQTPSPTFLTCPESILHVSLTLSPFASQIYLTDTTESSDNSSDNLSLVHHCIFKQSQKTIYKVHFHIHFYTCKQDSSWHF